MPEDRAGDIDCAFAGRALGVRGVLRVGADGTALVDDFILNEVPVAFVYNGISHAVMLATPHDLEDFALGFSLSEGILDNPAQCYGIDVTHGGDGIELAIEIGSQALFELKERRRSLLGRTGCGLCGVDSLRQVQRLQAPVHRGQAVTSVALQCALAAIAPLQTLSRQTGASHAAAWCDRNGQPVLVREDVGRHNALDKVVGAMARSGAGADDGFLLITSRVSLEMVQKCAAAGVAFLAGMSAPTLAAVELAEQLGITLVAFARTNSFVCYTHTDGILLSSTNETR
jgi:FdhD protein